MLRSDLGLIARAGESDLIIEPDEHSDRLGVIAHLLKNLPPRLREKRRIIRIATIERAIWSQIHNHDVANTHRAETIHLPAHPADLEPLAAPPPQRRGCESRIGLGELPEIIVDFHGP